MLQWFMCIHNTSADRAQAFKLADALMDGLLGEQGRFEIRVVGRNTNRERTRKDTSISLARIAMIGFRIGAKTTRK
jgi:hypothetical protein